MTVGFPSACSAAGERPFGIRGRGRQRGRSAHRHGRVLWWFLELDESLESTVFRRLYHLQLE